MRFFLLVGGMLLSPLFGSTVSANNLLDDGVIEHDSILELRDCYSGVYASADDYLEHFLSRFARLSERPEAQERVRIRYGLMERAREGVDCVWMTYEVDGYEVHGFIVSPEGGVQQGEVYPVVISLRGGNADSGRSSLRRVTNQVFPLAREGIVVIGTSYRGAAEFRGDHHPDRFADEFGGRDIDDVLALLPMIDSLPFADENRIGLWGNSRGAMMAYMAARESDRFSALVAMGGAVDLEKEISFRPEMEERVLSVWIPDFEERREEALEERSVIHWADELSENTAILILHGTADERVRPEGALEMALTLQSLKKDYKLVMFDGTDHGLHGHGNEVLRQVISWFDRHLR